MNDLFKISPIVVFIITFFIIIHKSDDLYYIHPLHVHSYLLNVILVSSLAALMSIGILIIVNTIEIEMELLN